MSREDKGIGPRVEERLLLINISIYVSMNLSIYLSIHIYTTCCSFNLQLIQGSC